jgi:Fur family transcriptional regulator, peroxide stress response regulator
MFQTRQELRARILQGGLKATQQRIVILEALVARHGLHPTAEEVFQQLQTNNPGISLGTVYKTLDSFVEAELVSQVFSAGSRRYDLNDQAHGHIYCTNTNEIIDFTDPDLDRLMAEFFQSRSFKNFSIHHVSVQIVGCKTDPEQTITIT